MQKFLKINRDSKIYILAPAGVVTGGVELLHQLCDVLNANTLNANIFYTGSSPHEIPQEYRKYNIKLTPDIEDNENNVLVLPEVSFDAIENIKNIQVLVWWLSVDNYFYHFYGSFTDNLRFNTVFCIKRLIRETVNKFLFRKPYPKFSLSKIRNSERIICHAYQSEYANYFLHKNGINNTVHLGDYINDDYVLFDGSKQKKDIIIYNPKKGIRFTKKLIKASPDLTWVPIQNMNRSQVKEVMDTAKVYVDFGYHPGKDRMPREAALCGCCIITGKLGAAGFFEDIAIDDSKYKFNQSRADIPLIIKRIRSVLLDFDTITHDFDNYREKIRSEKAEFEQDAVKLMRIQNGGGYNCRVVCHNTAFFRLCA